MKTRKLELGDKNIAGERVTETRRRKDMKQNELLVLIQTADFNPATRCSPNISLSLMVPRWVMPKKVLKRPSRLDFLPGQELGRNI